MKKLYFLFCFILFARAVTVQAQYNVLLNFNNTLPPEGSDPWGSLTLSAHKLYGMTYNGGAHYCGNVFSVKSNGTGFKNLLDFDSANGENPEGSVIVVNNKIYGMTYKGGIYDSGCVFSIDTGGGGYKKLLDFNGVNGQYPGGALTYAGNKLYGMTAQGGANKWGCIFSIDTDGNGYKDMHDFILASGEQPFGSLTLAGNKLYGMAEYGGAHDSGCIFSIDTGGYNYKDIFDFTTKSGAYPYFFNSLMLSGRTLFGTTGYGGTSNYGTVFSIDTTGSNFKKLYDFKGPDGGNPTGTLALAGSTLYGIGEQGGGYGVLYSIDTNGSGWTNIHNFGYYDGRASWGGSMILSGDTLFGMADVGSWAFGNIFYYVVCQNNSYHEPICMVTVDTATNKSEIIWGRTNSPPPFDSAYYDIYKESAPSVYGYIHSQPFDSLSEYIDPNSNPSSGPTSYELSTYYSCGESALSSPATTIFLTTTAGVNVFNLSWTAYVGFTPSVYRIFRGPTLGSVVEIDSVPNTTLTYHDTLPPPGSVYLIEAVNPNGACIPTAKIRPHSISSVNLSGSFSNGFNTAILGVQNIRSTISNLNIYPNPSNGQITIEWSVNSSQSGIRMTIYNELGQAVYDNTEIQTVGKNKKQLNLESLATGIYTLRMQTSGGTTVRKVVIMKK